MSLKIKSLVKFFLFAGIIMCFSNSVKAQSLLWKVEGNGLTKPSYLYGTIHMICPDDLVVSDALKKAFDKTDQLVLEIDMDAPGFMGKMQKLSVNKGMKNFSSELSEDDKKVINTFLKKEFNGTTLEQMGFLKPFALQGVILSKTLSCKTPASYEQTFVDLTKKQKEEVLGLEKVEDQFAIFDKIPQKLQLEWLVKHTKEFDKTKKEMQELFTVYKKEDLQGINKLILKSPEYKNYMDDLLFNRNKNWISKIESIAKNKPSIFAVGAAHLPGKKGVIKLLKKQGYKLTPVKQ